MVSKELYQAIGRGDKASIKQLIQRGVDLRARFKAGSIDQGILKITLTAALSKRFEIGFARYHEILELLLENGADPNETFQKPVLSQLDQDDDSEPEMVNIQVPIIGELLWTSLPISYLALFIKHGAIIDTVIDNYKTTPLHQCIQLGAYEKAKLLLDNGANPNTPDAAGYTPLMSAIESGVLDDTQRTEIIKLLVRHKDIDLTLKNDEGKTIKDIAIAKNDDSTLFTIAKQQEPGGTRYPQRFHRKPEKYQGDSGRSEREMRLHQVVRFR